MKKGLLLLFCCLFCVLHCHSQGYHKLVRENTFWDVEATSVQSICWTVPKGSGRFYFSGDTLINGMRYHRLFHYPFRQVNPGPFCSPFIIDTTAAQFPIYMREDTVTQKVYRYFSSHDELIFDFSLNLGDTLVTDYGTLLVQTVDTVTLLNGQQRKRISFDSGQYDFIEGIGGSMGIYSPLWLDLSPDGNGSRRGCVKEGGNYIFGNFCNLHFMQVAEPEAATLQLYPNPAQDFINVALPVSAAQPFQVMLVNAQGKPVLSETIAQQNQLNVNLLPTGMYFLHFPASLQRRPQKVLISR